MNAKQAQGPWIAALVARCSFCLKQTEQLTGPIDRIVVCPPSKDRAICSDCLREAQSACSRQYRRRGWRPELGRKARKAAIAIPTTPPEKGPPNVA